MMTPLCNPLCPIHPPKSPCEDTFERMVHFVFFAIANGIVSSSHVIVWRKALVILLEGLAFASSGPMHLSRC